MHDNLESSSKEACESVLRETRLGRSEAAFELKVAKIRKSFEKLNKLAASYDAFMLSKLSTLFEMSKPAIALEIIEARNLLLELQIVLRDYAYDIPQLDVRFERMKLDGLCLDLETFERKLLEGESPVSIS